MNSELLKELSNADSVASVEDEVRSILYRELAKYSDEVFSDRLGSIIFHKKGTSPNPLKIMFCAHIDEVGFMVRHISDIGFVYLVALGSVLNKSKEMQMVRITTQDGKKVEGLLNVTKDSNGNVKEMYVDIGVDSADEVKALGIDVGDMVCFASEARQIQDKVIAARSTVEFLAEWLRFLDGIMLLFIQGRVDVAQVLTRSLYEITLQLLYLIKDKETMNKKAICYVAFSELKKYSTNNNMIKNKNKIGVDTSKGEIENKKILESLGSSKNEELRFLYKYFLDKGLVDKDLKNDSWYSVYEQYCQDKSNGIKDKKIKNISTSILCEKVGFYSEEKGEKILVNTIVYNELSRQAHGVNARDSLKVIGGVQKFRNYDCLQNGLWQLSLIEEMKFLIIIYCYCMFEEKLGKISDETYSRLYKVKMDLDLLSKDLKALYIF